MFSPSLIPRAPAALLNTQSGGCSESLYDDMDFLAGIRTWRTRIILSSLPILLAVAIFNAGLIAKKPVSDKEAAGCKYQFLRYQPSPWESDWYRLRQELQQDETKVCAKFALEAANSEAWLKTVEMAVLHGDEAALRTADEHIFSSVVYENTCTKQQLSQLMEPLVGNFRHPHSIAHCKPPGPAVVDAENREYMLPAGMLSADLSRVYPGKRYLFDLGTGQYGSSLAWLIDAHRKRGVEFDEVRPVQVPRCESSYQNHNPSLIQHVV